MLIHRHHKLFTSLVRLSAVATAMLMLTVLIVTHSEAAFSDTTDNTSNTFATGSVVLSDDDGGSTAMFTATDMTAAVPVVECITVTYSGSLVPAQVKLYGTTSGALAPYLDTTIEVGSGGSFGDCTGFTPSGTIFNDTLANFSTGHFDWTSGQAVFTATTNPDARTLRFTVTVQDVPAAQGQAAAADFTFEAQD
jgi:hypothetical protein